LAQLCVTADSFGPDHFSGFIKYNPDASTTPTVGVLRLTNDLIPA
jgi:hypothetical protein